MDAERTRRDQIMHLRVSAALKRRIGEIAARERRTINAQVHLLLERALAEAEAAR